MDTTHNNISKLLTAGSPCQLTATLANNTLMMDVASERTQAAYWRKEQHDSVGNFLKINQRDAS